MKTRRLKLNHAWTIEHAGVVLDKTFKKAIDAWEWAMWNYKGLRCFRLKSISWWDDIASRIKGNK